jgi:hypothetical protein
MAKFILLFAFLIFSTSFAYSADIIVQSGDNATAHSTLSDAMDAASAGDFIYVPAGTYDVSELNFNKGVNIIGAGYNPNGPGNTVFTGGLKIYNGADGGSLQGVKIPGSLNFGTDNSNNTVNNFTITRCYINWVYFSFSWDADQNGSNFTFTENIVEGAVHGGNAEGVIISNNIIFQTSPTGRPLTKFKNAIISNNIVISIDDIVFNEIIGCIVRNNIFPVGRVTITNKKENNSLLNNLYTDEEGINPFGYSEIDGNVRIDRDLIFVDQAGGTFDYNHDYRLTDDASSAITGTDGTQVGIYGGDYPFKDGGAPINPQIIEKNISTATNPKGHLKVEIKVEAQNK